MSHLNPGKNSTLESCDNLTRTKTAKQQQHLQKASPDMALGMALHICMTATFAL